MNYIIRKGRIQKMEIIFSQIIPILYFGNQNKIPLLSLDIPSSLKLYKYPGKLMLL